MTDDEAEVLLNAIDAMTAKCERLQDENVRLKTALRSSINYHDALMRMRKITGSGGIFPVDDGDELERLFVAWHNAIAAALGVDP